MIMLERYQKQMAGIISIAILLSIIASIPDSAQADVPNKQEKVHFSLKFKDEINSYRILALFLMPGERIELECVDSDPKQTYMISAKDGAIATVSKKRWTWEAPQQHGMYSLTISETHSNDTMRLQAFVMVPFQARHEKLNGYRIGRYEQKPLKNNPAYRPPTGFVEVTPQNRHEQVSPSFTLGQFVAKQASGYPKYVVLRERLLLKLEMILAAVKKRGFNVSTLHVMSGYRTPFYNKAIGNPTRYSRHLYGDAADIFIDQDNNNVMDDLDGDGKVTFADAQTFASMIKSTSKAADYQPFLGGLGVYGPRSHRGPFVHVDVRGTRARWSNP